MKPDSPASEEILVWRGTSSQWTNFSAYFFCTLLAAAILAAYSLLPAADQNPLLLLGLLVPALWLLCAWIATKTHRYEITSERVKITTGLLSRHSTEVELYRVRDYSVIEPFWLRLVGCGDIVLATSDRTTPHFTLHAVPRARHLKDEIRQHTERMRQLRGVRDLEVDSPSSPPPS